MVKAGDSLQNNVQTMKNGRIEEPIPYNFKTIISNEKTSCEILSQGIKTSVFIYKLRV